MLGIQDEAIKSIQKMNFNYEVFCLFAVDFLEILSVLLYENKNDQIGLNNKIKWNEHTAFYYFYNEFKDHSDTNFTSQLEYIYVNIKQFRNKHITHGHESSSNNLLFGASLRGNDFQPNSTTYDNQKKDVSIHIDFSKLVIEYFDFCLNLIKKVHK